MCNHVAILKNENHEDHLYMAIVSEPTSFISKLNSFHLRTNPFSLHSSIESNKSCSDLSEKITELYTKNAIPFDGSWFQADDLEILNEIVGGVA